MNSFAYAKKPNIEFWNFWISINIKALCFPRHKSLKMCLINRWNFCLSSRQNNIPYVYTRYVLSTYNKCFLTRKRQLWYYKTDQSYINPFTCSFLLKTSSIKPSGTFNENAFRVVPRSAYKKSSWGVGAEKIGFNAHSLTQTTAIIYSLLVPTDDIAAR